MEASAGAFSSVLLLAFGALVIAVLGAAQRLGLLSRLVHTVRRARSAGEESGTNPRRPRGTVCSRSCPHCPGACTLPPPRHNPEAALAGHERPRTLLPRGPFYRLSKPGGVRARERQARDGRPCRDSFHVSLNACLNRCSCFLFHERKQAQEVER